MTPVSARNTAFGALLDKVFPRQAEVVDVAARAAAASSPADA